MLCSTYVLGRLCSLDTSDERRSSSWAPGSRRFVSIAAPFHVRSWWTVLTARIGKNVETRCDGLAPGLFVFSIFGNLTYALSICAESMDGAYLVKNASWLAGT